MTMRRYVMQQRRGPRHAPRGFTLAEMAIVLGIAGIVMAGIWATGSSVHENSLASDAFQELTSVADNFITALNNGTVAPASAVGADITATAIAAGAIQQQYINGAAALSPWGGGFNVFKQGNNRFRLSFFNIFDKQDVCIKLLMFATNCPNSQFDCPIQYQVDSGTVGGSTVARPAGGWAMTVANATAACALNDAANSSLEFDYMNQ